MHTVVTISSKSDTKHIYHKAVHYCFIAVTSLLSDLVCYCHFGCPLPLLDIGPALFVYDPHQLPDGEQETASQ